MQNLNARRAARRQPNENDLRPASILKKTIADTLQFPSSRHFAKFRPLLAAKFYLRVEKCYGGLPVSIVFKELVQ
jgi:hypothetical protein